MPAGHRSMSRSGRSSKNACCSAFLAVMRLFGSYVSISYRTSKKAEEEKTEDDDEEEEEIDE